MAKALSFTGVELLGLLFLACHAPPSSQKHASLRATPASLRPWLAPRPSSPFVCREAACRQDYPRLPSSGEWRCAERGQVVWCAGGQPAAGVVAGPADAHFRCGPRWGEGVARSERVCVDAAPEYPTAASTACHFEQERGIARVCTSGVGAVAEPPLPPHATPGCWLSRDCASGRCDRGVCECQDPSQCERGSCRAGHCAKAAP